MLKGLTAILGLALTVGSITASATPVDIPDFSMPRDVIQNADSVLIHSANPVERVAAVIQLAAARTAIDPDSAFAVPGFVASMAERETDATARGFLYLYRAQSLASIYSRNSYKYNNITAPLDPLPSNPALWSGEQYRREIDNTLESALALLQPVGNTPLGNYSDLIIQPDEIKVFNRIRDFAYAIAINSSQLVGNDSKVIKLKEDIIALCERGSAEWAGWLSTFNSVTLEDYNAYPDGLVGGILLNSYARDSYAHSYLSYLSILENTDESLIDVLEQYIKSQDYNEMIPYLKSILAVLKVPRIYFTTPNTVIPGRPFTVIFKASYAADIKFSLYKVDHNTDDLDRKTPIVTRTYAGDADNSNMVDSIIVEAPDEGLYIIQASIGKSKENSNIIIASTIAPFLVFKGGSCSAAFVSAVDNKPIKNADVLLNDKVVATTDARGMASFYFNSSGDYIQQTVSLRRGGVKHDFGNTLYINQNNYYFNGNGVSAHFYLSQPLYKPGDTVDWSCVVGRFSNDALRAVVCPELEVMVMMRDTNGNPVDSLTANTDEYGRVSSKFFIPEDRLAGIYTISLESTAYSQRSPYDAYTNFIVSEFKTPSIEIKEISAILNAAGDALIIKGKVTSYSGMPVVDARVSLSMSTAFPVWLRYFHPYIHENYNFDDVITDENGNFERSVSLSAINNDISYSVTATVTSQNGETATASTGANLDKHIYYDSKVGTYINIDDGERLNVVARYADGRNVDVDSKWTLLRNNEVVGSGNTVVTSAGCYIDLSPYPAGQYNLALNAVNNSYVVADTLSIYTYSINGNKVPAECALFVPKTSVTVQQGIKSTIKVGVPFKSSVYVFTISPSRVLASEMLTLGNGFHDMKLPDVPAGQQYKMVLATHTADGFETQEITVRGADPDDVVLRIESMRDNMVPGMPERITLRLSRSDGSSVGGGLVATMYNRAVEALGAKSRACQFNVSTDLFPFYTWGIVTYVGQSSLRKGSFTNLIMDNAGYRFLNLKFTPPMFAYPTPFAAPQVIMRNMALASAATAGVNYAQVVTESVEECVSYDDADYTAVGYGVVATKSIDEVAPAPVSDTDIRIGEIINALWRPSLNIDQSGEATISYYAPNDNGSWRLLASAWTETTHCSYVDTIMTTSKPVMVQPSLPRFLRRGDKITLPATLYNNTTESGIITYAVQIYDPQSQAVLKEMGGKIEAAAGAGVKVAIDITADYDLSTVAVKVAATLANYTDGEINYLPILDSGMTVIDSETFYLSSENTSYTGTVTPGDGVVSLQYYANPIWEAVKAMPSLNNSKPTNSISAAIQAFAALTARGLSRRYPEINQAIKLWEANPGDSTLVSNLSKNTSLKQLMLQQTPWMRAAASQAASMQQLAVTFDKGALRSSLNIALDVLENLQMPDGSFKWGTWSSKGTVWCTAAVLESLSGINSWDYYTGNTRLDAMIDRAFNYLDANLTAADAEMYCYVAAMYPSHKPATLMARETMTQGLQNAVKNWKNESTYNKARIALMLYNNQYEPVAREIIASLRQHEVKTPKTGITFPSVTDINYYATILQAFATIDPVPSELESMVQWLVVQTQTTTIGDGYKPTALITALLCAAEGWNRLNPDVPVIEVNSEPVNINRIAAVTGTLSITIPADALATVTVRRPVAHGIAYGSLNKVYNQPLVAVSQKDSEYLSISKRYLVNRGGEWVETDKFSVGDRVKVSLTINVGRDMEYVTITDERSATAEPVDQLPGYISNGAIYGYRTTGDSRSDIFITSLPKGTYVISYDVVMSASGDFASGPATIQSQYTPEFSARSGSTRIMVSAQ